MPGEPGHSAMLRCNAWRCRNCGQQRERWPTPRKNLLRRWRSSPRPQQRPHGVGGSPQPRCTACGGIGGNRNFLANHRAPATTRHRRLPPELPPQPPARATHMPHPRRISGGLARAPRSPARLQGDHSSPPRPPSCTSHRMRGLPRCAPGTKEKHEFSNKPPRPADHPTPLFPS